MSLRNFTVGVKRFDGVTTWVKGRPVNDSQTAFNIKCSVQPLTGKEMEALPEARRNRASYWVYTSTLLQTVEDRNPDTMTLFGEVYEVFTVEPWQNNIISHFKALAQKKTT